MIPLAFAFSYAGFAAWCFAMPAHWRQLAKDKPSRLVVTGLRLLGSVLLIGTLRLCATRWGWPAGSAAWFGILTASGLALIGLRAVDARLAAWMGLGCPVLAALLMAL